MYSSVCLVVRGFILFLNIKAFYKNQVFHSQLGKYTDPLEWHFKVGIHLSARRLEGRPAKTPAAE